MRGKLKNIDVKDVNYDQALIHMERSVTTLPYDPERILSRKNLSNKIQPLKPVEPAFLEPVTSAVSTVTSGITSGLSSGISTVTTGISNVSSGISTVSSGIINTVIGAKDDKIIQKVDNFEDQPVFTVESVAEPSKPDVFSFRSILSRFSIFKKKNDFGVKQEQYDTQKPVVLSDKNTLRRQG